ncbi:hypothetical protein I553_4433 [Mycobacterium xenopi 4042]|uniref:Uncharacterized protein n=1 Tax=Mycobacterium xenopi 4042 TaxID=1299334 RepID=X8AG66_MYCXE|nr:hypothetical protein I553_4433 [Mycobacterium xenopi 4042]
MIQRVWPWSVLLLTLVDGFLGRLLHLVDDVGVLSQQVFCLVRETHALSFPLPTLPLGHCGRSQRPATNRRARRITRPHSPCRVMKLESR